MKNFFIRFALDSVMELLLFALAKLVSNTSSKVDNNVLAVLIAERESIKQTILDNL